MPLQSLRFGAQYLQFSGSKRKLCLERKENLVSEACALGRKESKPGKDPGENCGAVVGRKKGRKSGVGLCQFEIKFVCGALGEGRLLPCSNPSHPPFYSYNTLPQPQLQGKLSNPII